MATLPAKYRTVFLVSTCVMAITTIPYLYGYSLQGSQPGRSWYSGFAYNISDSSVYLSWIRQASDGHFFQRNLFTTEAQHGNQFNIFFLSLGFLVRITGLTPPVIYHVTRFILGVAFLWSVWWLLGLLLANPRARMAAFLITCFSSGLGWAASGWDVIALRSPVDTWQPEAITFLSLYYSPLFAVSLLLMVGVIGWLWVAEQRQSYRAAIYAGLCGLLLGNIHTYDVITLGAVWGGFLILRRLVHGKWPVEAFRYGLIAGAMTFVSTAYTAYQVMTDPVFAKRAAVPTRSPSLFYYMVGYGLVFFLAMAGTWFLFKARSLARKEGASTTERSAPKEKGSSVSEWVRSYDATLLLVAWTTLNIALTYLPISFQRRLLMGEHLPISALAGIGLAGILPGIAIWKWRILLIASLPLLFVTNGRFMARDMDNLAVNESMYKVVRPYVYAAESSALEWIREHTPTDSPVQPIPWSEMTDKGEVFLSDITLATYSPGVTGHPVHLGHWGETPDFAGKIESWIQFMQPTTTDEWRQSFLRGTGLRYLLFTQKVSGTRYPAFWSNPPTYLKRIEEASNADVDLYEVELN
jgi:hypothetical protein